MGINCSSCSKEEHRHDDTPLLHDTTDDSSPETVDAAPAGSGPAGAGPVSTKSRKSTSAGSVSTRCRKSMLASVVPPTFDDMSEEGSSLVLRHLPASTSALKHMPEEGSSRVLRHLSASTLALKHLLTGGTAGTASTHSKSDEEEEEWEEVNESLEQLWEECYDLSELIEQTSDRVLRYHTEFLTTLYRQGNEDDQRYVDLMDSLATDLKKLPFKQVVSRLQSVVFSTDDQGVVDSGYLQTTRQAGRDLSKTLNEAYDLFLLTSRMGNDQFAERSCRVWKDIFKIHTEVERLTKKFEVLLSGPDLDGGVNRSDEENLWRILNLLLNVVRRKQNSGGADNLLRTGNLVKRIVELRKELNEGFTRPKNSGLMNLGDHMEFFSLGENLNTIISG